MIIPTDSESFISQLQYLSKQWQHECIVPYSSAPDQPLTSQCSPQALCVTPTSVSPVCLLSSVFFFLCFCPPDDRIQGVNTNLSTGKVDTRGGVLVMLQRALCPVFLVPGGKSHANSSSLICSRDSNRSVCLAHLLQRRLAVILLAQTKAAEEGE